MYEQARTLDNRNKLRRIVTGTTARIQAIKDMVLLYPHAYPLESSELRYAKPYAKDPVPDHGPRASWVWKLEFLRVLLLTLPQAERPAALSIHDRFSGTSLQLVVNDTSELMKRLGEPDYISLHVNFDIRVGYSNVTLITCKSEFLGMVTTTNDVDSGVWFDVDLIFQDKVEAIFSEYYPENDLDLGSFQRQYTQAQLEVDVPRKFTVYFGAPDEHGLYYQENYQTTAMSPRGRRLIRSEHRRHQDVSAQDVGPDEVIAWMVADLALRLPGEDKFLVHYDPEEKSIAILPGDPHVGADTLAEVLHEGGTGLLDSPQP